MSGLSFCVKNTESNAFVQYFEYPTTDKTKPEILLKDFINAFETQQALQADFSSVRVIHDNALVSLVPQELLDTSDLSKFLKYNVALLPTDFIAHDELNSLNCAVVFVPFVNINNYVFEHFGSFEYHHQATILLQRLHALSESSNNTILRLHIQDDYFEAICFKGKQLLCYNRFSYQTSHDFLFYLLFLIEQLNLDPETLNCELFGRVNSDHSCFKDCYTYIRNTRLLEPMIETEFLNLKHNFVALNSF